MMDSWGETHVGLVRPNNEDAFGLVPELDFYLVADGLGGAAAGETASRIAVDTLVAESRAAAEPPTIDGIVQAVELANRRIRWEAENDPALHGMATTLTAAIVGRDTLGIVNVGDSRAYRFRAGTLKCLTDDHTWLRDLSRDRCISPEQLKTHPYRNMLTKAVGAETQVGADTVRAEFSAGDILLLCSDGLHDVLGEDEISGALALGGSLKGTARGLIKATLARGAPDNVTVVLVRNSGVESKD